MSEDQTNPAPPPQSILQRRLKKFRSLKRGWYSFLLLFGALFISFFNPVLVNNKALMVSYNGETYFPAVSELFFQSAHIEARDLGQRRIGEAHYRELKTDYEEAGEGNRVILAPYPFSPTENLLKELDGRPPHKPMAGHWMGTDNRGRDVFARLIYGFRISVLFGLGVVSFAYTIGITAGAILGFFGGKVDIVGQRLVEIWGAMPFLYTVIIISSIVRPSFLVLMPLLALFRWVGISYFMRGEFYREKSKDYVAAAIAQGESRPNIMFRHLLPNSLTPVVSFAPFAFVAAIFSLVSLDFLGFGLQPPTPSWGEMVKQAHSNNFTDPHLVFFPLGAIFLTLLMAVFIGEAVREAFDPRRFSRLR